MVRANLHACMFVHVSMHCLLDLSENLAWKEIGHNQSHCRCQVIHCGMRTQSCCFESIGKIDVAIGKLRFKPTVVLDAHKLPRVDVEKPLWWCSSL